MRFFWLAALCALAIVMAVLTPYVFRHEPLWQAVGWSVMLAGTISLIAVLLRMERQLRIVDRQARNEP